MSTVIDYADTMGGQSALTRGTNDLNRRSQQLAVRSEEEISRLIAHYAGRKAGGGRHQNFWPFLIPSAVVLALVLFYPLSYALYLSFFAYDFGTGSQEFIGFQNYTALLSEERFWEALGQTCAIVFAAVSLEFCVGLLVAYGLYRLTFGARVLNLLMFLPYVVTPAVAALFLRWMLIGRFGLISGVLIWLGIYPPDFLGSPGWARASVVMADFWQFTPFMIMVLYAGLNTVDQSQIEAAQMDGAGPWTILFRIMLPAIKPLIVFVLAIRMMDAFRFFDTIYVLTAGGPGTATETITMYTYRLAFRLLDVGKASALGVLTMLFLLALTIILCLFIYRGNRSASE